LRHLYLVSSPASASIAEIDTAQDLKICIARYLDRNWANYVPVYAYQFNDRNAPSYFKPVSYPMRAYHTAELQYLFPLFHGGAGAPHPLNAAQQTLSDQMVDYWTSFATNGAPTALIAAAWPPYSAMSDDVQYLDSSAITTASSYGADHHCDLWKSIATGGK
jgi:para-nitrobenzyl esterase